MMKFTTRLFAVLLAALFLSACEFTLAADVTPPPGYQPPPAAASAPEATSGPLYPLLPPNPVEGKLIYDEKCAPCHGESGMGDGPQAANLPNPASPLGDIAFARQASPAQWFGVVTQGNLERFMPPFASLTDRQRWDVVAYVFSLSIPQGSLSVGDDLYQANCAECHAPGGAPVKPGVPDLSSQETMAAKSAQDLFQAITNGAQDMPAFGEKLGEEERWALAHYLRTFTFAVHAGPVMQPTAAAPLTVTQAVSSTAQISATLPATVTLNLGSIGGTVINASGGAIPAGLEINLHGFDGMDVVITATTTTTENGAYLFPNIELTPGRFFLTTVEFQEITYGSEVITAEAGKPYLELPLQVYESSRDASILSVDRLHFFFELTGAGTLRVVELYVISNPSSKTVIAAAQGDPVVSFILPENAVNLEFQDGEVGGRYVLTGDGFADTMPVRPGIGAYQVMFSYELPYQNKLSLVRPTTMDTNAVVVLVPEDGLKIKGDNIQDAGVRDVQGMPYHLYNGSGVQAGQEIRLTVSSNFSLLPSGSSTNLLVGLAALGVVMIAAGVWLYRRNQKGAVADLDEDAADDEEEEETAAETPEALMDAILALDDLHQAGQLPEDAYIQRRQELRARLKAQLDKQG